MSNNNVFCRRTFLGAPEFSKSPAFRSRRTWEGTPTGNRGSALLIAILLVAVLGIGSAALFKHLNRSFDDYARFERELKLTHYADAGIDAAIAALHTGDAPEMLELALGEGRIRVKVEREAETLGYGQRLMQRLVKKNLGTWHITSKAALEHEGIVRAEETYSARVRITPTGEVQRLSWQREKKQ